MPKTSAGVNRGRTPGTTTKTAKSLGTKAIKNMRASKNIDLAPIISGTPSQVREKFKELEENGDLIRDEAGEPTDPPDPSELRNLDSEVEITDEDAPDFDTWENKRPSSGRYFVFRGEHDDDEESAIMDDDYFKLVIGDGGCSPCHTGIDLYYRQGTRRGKDALFAFTRRCKVLESIAKWLESDRAEFLKDNSWVNLGPKDYEEVKEKRVTVIQKSFLEYLNKRTKKAHQIDESQFSRYLETCRIVWPDKGSMPVKRLFCEEARNGWAAKSIMIFAEKYGHNIANIISKDIEKAPKNTQKKQEELRKAIDDMDINKFVFYTNLVAQTSWNNIKPILEDLNEKKRRNT